MSVGGVEDDVHQWYRASVREKRQLRRAAEEQRRELVWRTWWRPCMDLFVVWDGTSNFVRCQDVCCCLLTHNGLQRAGSSSFNTARQFTFVSCTTVTWHPVTVNFDTSMARRRGFQCRALSCETRRLRFVWLDISTSVADIEMAPWSCATVTIFLCLWRLGQSHERF